MKRPVYREIASRLQAAINCEKSNNTEWYNNHIDAIDELCKNFLPHGSGFDSGTTLNYEKSNPEKLVFNSGFYHMDENGFYDGWSELTITVKPSLAFFFNLKITGIRRKNSFDKEYFYDEFNHCLTKEYDKSYGSD